MIRPSCDFSGLLSLSGPAAAGLVEPELHEVSSYCLARQEEGLRDDAVTVTESEEVCLQWLRR